MLHIHATLHSSNGTVSRFKSTKVFITYNHHQKMYQDGLACDAQFMWTLLCHTTLLITQSDPTTRKYKFLNRLATRTTATITTTNHNPYHLTTTITTIPPSPYHNPHHHPTSNLNHHHHHLPPHHITILTTISQSQP